MSVQTKTNIVLMSTERDIIVRGEWLTDMHMYHFQRLLENCSDYRIVETWRIQCPDTIRPVSKDKKHIQILHSSSSSFDGHWVCSYYNMKDIFIYDSLNSKKLHEHHKKFLTRLFPTYNFEKHSVKFPTVQRQPNGNDCGVFAIAFAISLLFNIKPEKVKYDHNLMRLHLLKIFETNVIEHFPQDLQYIPQKVLPLAVVKARETEVIRMRTKRQYEIKQQKLRLEGTCEISQFKKDSSNNQLQTECISKQCPEILTNLEIEGTCEISQFKKDSSNNQLQTECISKQCPEILTNLENNRAKKRQRYAQDLENNRAKKRRQYALNLENNRAKKRQQYVQDLENNRAKKRQQYVQDLENNRAKKRQRYAQDLENNRAKKRQRYAQDLENNRAKKRQRYAQDLENNRAKKRQQYVQDLKNNRAKKRNQYTQDSVRQCAQKRERYYINIQHKRDRQKKLDSNDKWLYNKRYYQKKLKIRTCDKKF